MINSKIESISVIALLSGLFSFKFYHYSLMGVFIFIVVFFLNLCIYKCVSSTWKHFWKSFSETPFIAVIALLWKSASRFKMRFFSNFNYIFSFLNMKQSHGARSGEYVGCSNTCHLVFVLKLPYGNNCVHMWIVIMQNPLVKQSTVLCFCQMHWH